MGRGRLGAPPAFFARAPMRYGPYAALAGAALAGAARGRREKPAIAPTAHQLHALHEVARMPFKHRVKWSGHVPTSL